MSPGRIVTGDVGYESARSGGLQRRRQARADDRVTRAPASRSELDFARGNLAAADDHARAAGHVEKYWDVAQ